MPNWIVWNKTVHMYKNGFDIKLLYTIIQIHVYIYKYMRNIIKHNIRTSMNEGTHFFIKIYLSHFILERVDVGCVWEMSWRQEQTAILNPSSYSTIAALLSHLGWVAQPWVTEGPKSSVCSWVSLRWHPVSNWLEPPRAPGYIIFWRPPASAVLPLIYTGASLDCRLSQGLIYNKMTYNGWYTIKPNQILPHPLKK